VTYVCRYCGSALVIDGFRMAAKTASRPASYVCPNNAMGHDIQEESRWNCLQGHAVHNRHDNCPHSLMCAVCDMETP
jgi:hypothetical protein